MTIESRRFVTVDGNEAAAYTAFAALIGRQYHLFDYSAAADAERVVVRRSGSSE